MRLVLTKFLGSCTRLAPSFWALFMVGIAAVLGALGLVVLASASLSLGASKQVYFQKQFSFWILAVLAGYGMYRVPLVTLRRSTWVWAGAALVLLGLVLVPGVGVKVNGARRWLDAGLMRIQVSELAKVALVLVLAHYTSVCQHQLREFRQGFLYPVGIVVLCTGLILLEPDFGTAFLCAAVGFILLFLVGVRLRYWVPCVLSGFFLFLVAVWLSPVRLRRITAFLDVQANKQDSAYQLWQGILAFGSGGIQGVGLGQGRQQWSFLPEAHTDFIFPIVGEELGVFFTLGVATLFILMFGCGILAVRWACDMYSFVLAMGALLFVTLQAFINMAVVMGLVPTKGMPLPFISYGGSNLLVMCLFLGLFLNCCKAWEHLPLQAREL